MRLVPILLASILATSCSDHPPQLRTGNWQGLITLQGQELAFNFDIVRDGAGYKVHLINAGEKILLDEVTLFGDSVDIVLHVFDASLRAKIEGDQLTGTFVKNYNRAGSLPFRANYGIDYRYAPASTDTDVDFSGKYQVEFKTEKETYASVGVFEQKGNHLTGTFLAPNGDYRFLEGNVVNGELWLSTFDGNHAFLFKAVKSGDSVRGDYYSGKSAHETWAGVRNDQAKMPDPEALTYLKPGFEKLEFTFPDLEGNPVSSSDERFKNKVVILQIFGTWCPNCMDETKFLSQWLRDNKDRDVVIVGLAYERKPEFDYAVDRVRKMKNKWDVGYDFLIAGVNDKEKASLTLPALSKVLAFPTTIYVGRDGKVKHIRTGFEGPGTGIYHDLFKQRFNEIVNELLAEGLASGNKQSLVK